MLKRCSLFLLVLPLLMTCAGSPVSSPSPVSPLIEPSFSLSAPEGNGLVFIGVAERRTNRQKTIQFALEDAARRVAVFQRVAGEFAVENNTGSGAFDYTHNTYTVLYYDVDGSKQYVDALQFNADTDIIEIENAFIVRTTYPAALPVQVTYRPVYHGADQKPDWVDNPSLEIEGYQTAVSYSARYSSLADTYTNSYHNAILAIIRNINTASRSADVLYRNTGSLFGYKTSSDNVLYSHGVLMGFYVLDTWLDPHTKSVWTLAIAKIE